MGAASTYALAPPLATLLQKRKLVQDQGNFSQIESGTNQGITSGTIPEEDANAQGDSQGGGTRGQANKDDERTPEAQETPQPEEEQEEPAGAESTQQFSVAVLQDLETAATGLYQMPYGKLTFESSIICFYFIFLNRHFTPGFGHGFGHHDGHHGHHLAGHHNGHGHKGHHGHHDHFGHHGSHKGNFGKHHDAVC